MIQLSNVLSMNPETPAKTVGAGLVDGGFADLLAGELESDPAVGGKALPVSLPEGGKILPVGLPVAAAVDLPGELPVAAPVAAQAPAAPEEVVAKAPVIGPIVIPSIKLAAAAMADGAPVMADDAEPKADTPRAESVPPVAAKAIVVELKARIRADRPAADEAAKPTDPEAADAVADDTADAPVIADEISVELPEALLAVATAVAAEQVKPVAENGVAPEEQPATDAVQSEGKRADVRMPAATPNPVPAQTAEAGELVAGKDGSVRENAGQPMEKDTSQGEGGRGQRGAPELRFELSRTSGERAVAAPASQTSQIRMPLAAASQIVVPETAAIAGQVADAPAMPGATNQASTSFASQQALRPHEFTTLVDRLVEARETARGGSVNVAVMHADFGEVSLRFRQDANGLSVSMSNSDPEFARAVSAASQADGAQMGDTGGQGARRDDAAQNGGTFSRGGSNGEWGQSSADAQMNGGGRQHMQDDARGDQVAAQSRPTVGEERPGQGGIYA